MAFWSLGLVRYTRESARYHFLFYPVVLATHAAAALQLAGLGRGFLMFAAAFMLSGDFNPSHIAAADKPSVAFRTGPFAQKARLWYHGRTTRAWRTICGRLSRKRPMTSLLSVPVLPWPESSSRGGTPAISLGQA